MLGRLRWLAASDPLRDGKERHEYRGEFAASSLSGMVAAVEPLEMLHRKLSAELRKLLRVDPEGDDEEEAVEATETRLFSGVRWVDGKGEERRKG